jgi:hypothetical protein
MGFNRRLSASDDLGIMRLKYAGMGGQGTMVRRSGGVMRILLAAVNAAKGDVAGNLRRHQTLLEQGRVQGCQLVVFPELSLTGSVDPGRHPERALALDAPPVRALVEATWRVGVA